MKKIITKVLSVLLVLAMLVPMMGIMTSASTTSETKLTNIYKPNNYTFLTTGANKIYSYSNYNIKPGDVITFGPVLSNSNGSTIYTQSYDSEARRYTTITSYAAKKYLIDEIAPGVGIMQITVPDDGATYFRCTVKEMFNEATLITVNQPFGVEEYLDYANSKGVALDFFFEEYTGVFNNVFPAYKNAKKGRYSTSYNSKTGKYSLTSDSNSNYCSSGKIAVNENDIICFNVSSGAYRLIFGNKAGDDFVQVSIGTANMIRIGNYYFYVVPKTASYMYITARTTYVKQNRVAVTINQPILSTEDYQFCINPFTPAKAQVTMQTEWTYTGKEITPEIAIEFNGKVLTAGTDYTLTYENNLNAGVGAAVVEYKGHYAGYTIAYPFVIAPKMLEVVWGETEHVYDFLSFVPTFEVNGILEDAPCEVTVSGAAKEVGVYTATLSVSNPNYVLSDATCEFEITENPYVNAYYTGVEVYEKTSDAYELLPEEVKDVIEDAAADAAQSAAKELGEIAGVLAEDAAAELDKKVEEAKAGMAADLENASNNAEAIIEAAGAAADVAADKTAEDIANSVAEAAKDADAAADKVAENIANAVANAENNAAAADAAAEEAVAKMEEKIEDISSQLDDIFSKLFSFLNW